MAKKEEPIVDNEVGKIKVKEKKEQQPTGNETKGNITKVKAKMKKSAIDLDKETITKVDLNKPPKPEENEVKENNTNNEGVAPKSEDANAPQKQEEVQPETKTQEAPALEEVTNEKVKEKENIKEAIAEVEKTGQPLPENIQKLVNFMEETGGDLNDYVKLNQDYSKLDNQDLLYEYYKQTKPHLDNEEINFLMEDQFSYDEENDDEKEIKRKKLALKEQVASAKSHLDGQKSKYYKDIKAGSKLTNEQQKAVDFFNRYKKEEEETEKRKSIFENKTNQVFNDQFKGFEYNVGDKNYRFNVSDKNEVKNNQSDLTNFVGKFLDENNNISDADGYHKSLFTAMNADAVAKHFYEQGKADAMKDSVAKAKNVDMNPRQSHGVVETGGIKVRVLGEDSSDFKFKIKNKK
tara:strand:- start:700 stop:1917 length:1218 start_codon:yes stop_codon:yes gene_type:complete